MVEKHGSGKNESATRSYEQEIWNDSWLVFTGQHHGIRQPCHALVVLGREDPIINKANGHGFFELFSCWYAHSLLFVVPSKGSWKHDFTCPNIRYDDGLETYAITIT